ncbi:MAG: AAA family ATPase [Fimbriimonas sp.]
MILHRLRLENFRQHAETEVAFDLGMTAVVGPNGAGKSTLVEAIGFALYGEQRDKKETVRFHWATGKRFLVRLEFSLGERRFTVERTDRDATLIQMGEPEVVRAEGLSETTRACERLLALNYDQFTNSFCAEQKQLAFLQFRSNAVRQEEVARMLGFDRLRGAEELAALRRREAALQREALERTLADPAELKADRDRAAARLAESGQILEAATRRMAELQSQAAAVEATRRQAERWLTLAGEIQIREGEASGISALVDRTAAALQEARAELDERQGLEADYQAYRVAESGLRQRLPLRMAAQAAEAARHTLRASEVELARAASERAALGEVEPLRETARSTLERAEAELEAASIRWTAKREATVGEAASAQAHAVGAKRALERAEASMAGGRCPECGQPVTEAYGTTLKERRDAVETAAKAAEAARVAAADAASEPADVRDAKAALTSAAKALRDADAKFAKLDLIQRTEESLRRSVEAARKAAEESPAPDALAELDRTESEVNRLRPLYARYEALATAPKRFANREREHGEASNRLAATRQSIEALVAERDTLPFPDAAAAGHAVREHQTLAEEIVRLGAEEAGARASREVAERDLRHAEERLAAQAVRAEEVRQLRNREGLHDACAREMRALRQELNAGVGPELAAHAGENLSLLTHGRYTALELDRNFAPSVIEDGIRKPVLSGGEEDVVALSLRLALSELIQERSGQPMSLLILDEVFGSLDVERRQAVLDRLAALHGRFAQILVITHLEDIHQIADRVLYVSRDPATRATTLSEGLPTLMI